MTPRISGCQAIVAATVALARRRPRARCQHQTRRIHLATGPLAFSGSQCRCHAPLRDTVMAGNVLMSRFVQSAERTRDVFTLAPGRLPGRRSRGTSTEVPDRPGPPRVSRYQSSNIIPAEIAPVTSATFGACEDVTSRRSPPDGIIMTLPFPFLAATSRAGPSKCQAPAV
jgi:hypothetical protein